MTGWRSSHLMLGEWRIPSYPIGFFFGSPLLSAPLLRQTSIAEASDLKPCGDIAAWAVDRGHRGRGVGPRSIEAYVACRVPMNDVLTTTLEGVRITSTATGPVFRNCKGTPYRSLALRSSVRYAKRLFAILRCMMCNTPLQVA